MIVDGYEIDYPDDHVSQKFCDWILSPKGRATEKAFTDAAMEYFVLFRRGEVGSSAGYPISQWIRVRYGHEIMNDFGPILARLCVAKNPELAPLFPFKATGWGKARRPPEWRLL